MTQFLTLLKLEFLTKSNRSLKRTKVLPRIIRIVILLLAAAVLFGVALFAFSGVIKVCMTSDIEHEFIIFYALIVQLVQLLFGLGLTTKTLYFNADSDLLKLPVSGAKIFLAKITYLFIFELIFSTALSLPVFIMFGVLTGQGALFFVLLLPNILLFPMMPFLFALLLSVPTMYIVGYLKNKFIVMLILYVVFVAVGFSVYIYALKLVLSILQSSGISAMFSSEVIMGIKGISNYLYPQVLFKNMLLGYHFFSSFIVSFSICAVMAMFVYLIAKKHYLKLLLANIDGDTNKFSKKTKVVDRSTTRALFFREFLTIFRSVNYSFQYLTVVITTPLMVYFSNSIASSIGASVLGEGILPGISVLVLIMFLSVGSSFAATSLTREGGNFFHTKIIPVSYTKQILVKFLLYVIVAVPSIVLSCACLAVFDFISYLDAALISVAVILVIIGNICGSMIMDIKRPQFMYLASGKEITGTNKNINMSLSTGFVIASIMGIGSIIISFFISVPAIYLVLFGFSIPYVIIECFRLFYKIESRYKNIEA